MRKLKLYLDTSIFNFAVSRQVPEYREVTLQLLKRIKAGQYDGYLSEITMREINAAGKEKSTQLKTVINELSLKELEINAEIELLAEEYMKAKLIPSKYTADALHIAVASYHEMDAIISWNFEHMVKWKTKRGVISINTLNEYKSIEIISPLEVN